MRCTRRRSRRWTGKGVKGTRCSGEEVQCTMLLLGEEQPKAQHAAPPACCQRPDERRRRLRTARQGPHRGSSGNRWHGRDRRQGGHRRPARRTRCGRSRSAVPGPRRRSNWSADTSRRRIAVGGSSCNCSVRSAWTSARTARTARTARPVRRPRSKRGPSRSASPSTCRVGPGDRAAVRARPRRGAVRPGGVPDIVADLVEEKHLRQPPARVPARRQPANGRSADVAGGRAPAEFALRSARGVRGAPVAEGEDAAAARVAPRVEQSQVAVELPAHRLPFAHYPRQSTQRHRDRLDVGTVLRRVGASARMKPV